MDELQKVINYLREMVEDLENDSSDDVCYDKDNLLEDMRKQLENARKAMNEFDDYKSDMWEINNKRDL